MYFYNATRKTNMPVVRILDVEGKKHHYETNVVFKWTRSVGLAYTLFRFLLVFTK